MSRGYHHFDIYFTVLCQAMNQKCLNHLEKVIMWEQISLSVAGTLCVMSLSERVNLFKPKNSYMYTISLHFLDLCCRTKNIKDADTHT